MYRYIIFIRTRRSAEKYLKVFIREFEQPIQQLLDNKKLYIETNEGEIIMKHSIDYIEKQPN